jgi:hypothetical protein
MATSNSPFSAKEDENKHKNKHKAEDLETHRSFPPKKQHNTTYLFLINPETFTINSSRIGVTKRGFLTASGRIRQWLTATFATSQH